MNLNDINLTDDVKFYRDFIDKNNENDKNDNDDKNKNNKNDNNNHNRTYNDDDNLTIITARENYQNSSKTNIKNDVNRTKHDINKSDSLTNVNLVQPTSPYDHKSGTYVSTDYITSPEFYDAKKKIEYGTNTTNISKNGTVDNNLTFNEETKEISGKNSTDVSTVDILNEDDFLDDHSHLLIHVKDIRSEKQLTALIEYIQDGYISIENTDIEKKKLKKLIKGGVGMIYLSTEIFCYACVYLYVYMIACVCLYVFAN